MVESILKLGLTMASYAASSAFSRKAVQFAATNLRKAVSVYRESEAFTSSGRVTGQVVNAVDRLVGSAPGRGSIAQGFEQLDRAVGSKVPAAWQKTYAAAKNVVKDEARFLPANYLWYRVEKNAAITPEQKEDTRSFSSYYLGPRMIASMGSGLALSHMPDMKRVLGKTVKSLSTKNKERIVSGYAAVSRFATGVIENAEMIRFAAQTAMRGKGIASVFTPKRILPAARDFAREVQSGAAKLKQIKELRQHSPGSFESNMFSSTVLAQTSRLEQLLSRKRKDTAKSTRPSRGDMRALEEHHNRVLGNVITSYNKAVEKGTVFTRFWNEYIAAGEHEQFRPAMTKVTGQSYYHGDIAMDPSRLSFNGKQYNFGRMGSEYLKDAVIGQSMKGMPAFLTRMFGVHDALASQRMAAKYGSAFTEFSRSGNLVFPTKLLQDNERASDAFRRMIVEPEGGMSTGEKDELARTLVKNRTGLFMNHPSLSTLSYKERRAYLDSSGRDILEKSLLHGSMPVGNKDLLVHMPGGKMYLYASIESKGVKGEVTSKQITLDLGRIHPEIDDLTYLKYTSQRNTTTDSLRYFVGSEDITVHGKDVAARSFHVGPDTSGGRQSVSGGLWKSIADRFELGRGSESSMFSKIGSVFSKFTSLATPLTFYSNVGIENAATRSSIVNSIGVRNQEAYLHDALGVVRESSQELWDRFYTAAREKGSAALNAHIDDIGISYKSSFGAASERIGSAITGIMQRGKPEGAIENYMVGDMRELMRVREMLLEETAAPYAGSVLAGTKANRTPGVFGRMNLYDATNATLLKHHIGSSDDAVGQMASLIDDPSLRRLFDAARHGQKLETGLGEQYAKITTEMGQDEIAASRGKVDDILRSLIGPTNKDYLNYKQTLLSGSKHRTWMWRDEKPRELAGGEWRDTFLLTGEDRLGIISKRRIDHGNGAYSEIPEGMMGTMNSSIMSFMRSFNRVGNETIGIGFDEMTTSTPGAYAAKMLTKRIAPMVGLYLGFQAVDRITDATLDGTPLGEGVSVFAANAYANVRMASQGILDMTGITGTAKWMEDVMPGSISSPMSGAVRGFGPAVAGLSLGYRSGGPAGALMGGIVGGAVGMLVGGGPLGMFDSWNISKNRKEVVQELIGQDLVPVRSGAFWEMSAGPFLGGRISYFKPSAYAMARAKPTDTPGLKDSLFDEVIGTIAPDYYGLKNYYSRPYPVTAGLLSNIPIVSSMSAMLPGMPLGAGIRMHEDDVSASYMNAQNGSFGMYQQQLPGAQQDVSIDGLAATMNAPYMGENPIERSSLEYGVGSAVSNLRDIVGLRGFMSGQLFSGLTGRRDYFDYAPVMATPADVSNIAQSFSDMNIGGMLGTNEALRRYLPGERSQMQIFNPISNAMPLWLPGSDAYTDFRHGDPYTSVTDAAARLPGRGYDTVHDVSYSFPLTGETFGMEKDSQISYLLGFSEFMQPYNTKLDAAKAIGQEYIKRLNANGSVLKTDLMLYSAPLDMSSSADAMVKGPDGKSMAVKVAARGMNGEHSMNAFLAMSNTDYGQLIEVDPETGGISQRMVSKDLDVFRRDLAEAQAARVAAAQAMPALTDSGKAMNLGGAYSHMDRFRMLADVAPYSAQFRHEKAIIDQQMAAGTLSNQQLAEVPIIMSQVEQKKQGANITEYRFLNLGESLTYYGKARDRKIYQEYSAFERGVGASWEKLTHLRNPLQVKMYQSSDALELYEANVVYGKGMKMWDNPVEDYLKTYGYEMAGVADPMQGASIWGSAGVVGGALLGGPVGTIGLMMSAIGAGVGAVNSTSSSAFIPQRTADVRDVMAQYDAVQYAKYQKLYQETGDKTFLNKANRTMTATLSSGTALSPEDLAKSAYKPDRDYLASIINNATTGNIDRIRAILPEYALPSLDAAIGNVSGATETASRVAETYLEREVPGLDSSMYDMRVPDSALAIQEFENRGMNAHDVGMGWYKQIADINRMREYGLMSKDASLFPGAAESRVDVRTLTTGINMHNDLHQALSRAASNISIIDDVRGFVELEIVVRR